MGLTSLILKKLRNNFVQHTLYEVIRIHKLQINLYDLDGELLITSKAKISNDTLAKCIDSEILNALSTTIELDTITNTVKRKYVAKHVVNGETFFVITSYSIHYTKLYEQSML